MLNIKILALPVVNCVPLGTVSPSIKLWGGRMVKTVLSQRLYSSKDGNGDSNSKAQATQGTREHWSSSQLGSLDQGRAKGLTGQNELL